MTLELVLIQLVVALVCFGIPLAILPLFIWLERRLAAWIQDRVGPNRVGPFGLMQPLADVIKLVFKEDVIPRRVDKLLFTTAPMFAFVPGMVALAVIPFGPGFYFGDSPDPRNLIVFQGADLAVGILFFFAMTALGAYAQTFGGWASNSKYPQLGGIRASAQVISYEIALGIGFITILIMAADPASGVSGFRLSDVVWDQVRSVNDKGEVESSYLFGFLPLTWNIFRNPIAFLIFFIASLAETNRAPFDMPEAEPELVGGFHTEYSAFKFAMFFMGEYLGMMLMACLITLLFLGGWHFPGLPVVPEAGWWGLFMALIGFAVFLAKMMIVVFLYMQIRWTFPRFRYDQLMGLGWKVLIPIGLANLIVTALVVM